MNFFSFNFALREYIFGTSPSPPPPPYKFSNGPSLMSQANPTRHFARSANLFSHSHPPPHLTCLVLRAKRRVRLRTLTHVNFNHLNKIEAKYKVLKLNGKLNEVLLLRLRATFHSLPLYNICGRKFYARIMYGRKNYAIVEVNRKPWKQQSAVRN